MSPEMSARVDASDILQETEMEVVRRIDEFVQRRPSSFRVWLRSRAIEQVIDQHRRHVTAAMRSVHREQRVGDASSLAIAKSLLTESPSKSLRRSELAEQVRDLIDSLSDIDREVITMRHAEGLSNLEVAEALQLDPMTARKRYGRALRRLVEKANGAGLARNLSWSDH
jgi:RNA polymerase sigma-70 factor (ECF subfamily)